MAGTNEIPLVMCHLLNQCFICGHTSCKYFFTDGCRSVVRLPILTFAVRSKQVVCQVFEILRQVDVEFQKGILDNQKKNNLIKI